MSPYVPLAHLVPKFPCLRRLLTKAKMAALLLKAAASPEVLATSPTVAESADSAHSY